MMILKKWLQTDLKQRRNTSLSKKQLKGRSHKSQPKWNSTNRNYQAGKLQKILSFCLIFEWQSNSILSQVTVSQGNILFPPLYIIDLHACIDKTLQKKLLMSYIDVIVYIEKIVFMWCVMQTQSTLGNTVQRGLM